MPVDPTSWMKRAEQARRRAKANQNDQADEATVSAAEAQLALQTENPRYVPSDR
jgi:hypothetical protein